VNPGYGENFSWGRRVNSILRSISNDDSHEEGELERSCDWGRRAGDQVGVRPWVALDVQDSSGSFRGKVISNSCHSYNPGQDIEIGFFYCLVLLWTLSRGSWLKGSRC